MISFRPACVWKDKCSIISLNWPFLITRHVFSIFDEQKIERFLKTFKIHYPSLLWWNVHHWFWSYIFHFMTEYMQNATEKRLNHASNRMESEFRVDKLWWIRKKERKWHKINWNQKPVLPQRKKERKRGRDTQRERKSEEWKQRHLIVHFYLHLCSCCHLDWHTRNFYCYEQDHSCSEIPRNYTVQLNQGSRFTIKPLVSYSAYIRDVDLVSALKILSDRKKSAFSKLMLFKLQILSPEPPKLQSNVANCI